MSNLIVQDTSLTAIADAVRSKLGMNGGYAFVDSNKIVYTPQTGTIESGVSSNAKWLEFLWCDSIRNLTTVFGQRPAKVRLTVTSTGYSGKTVSYGSDLGISFTQRVSPFVVGTTFDISLSSVNHSDPIYLFYIRVDNVSVGDSLTSFGWELTFLDSNNQTLSFSPSWTGTKMKGFHCLNWTLTDNNVKENVIDYTVRTIEGQLMSLSTIANTITSLLVDKRNLKFLYHINPKNNESGSEFSGTPLAQMNVLDYGVTSVSQIKFMLFLGASNRSATFTWKPSNSYYSMIVNGEIWLRDAGANESWPDDTWTHDNSGYSLRLSSEKVNTQPLGIYLGTSSTTVSNDDFKYPRIVFMVLDLEG